jgi:hypothetical protein
MTILLTSVNGYKGYPSGNVITIDDPTEAALIAQGLAQTSSAAATPGPVSLLDVPRGRAGIAIGASSVTITNNMARQTSAIYAIINQAADDATLTSIRRVNTANGSFTIVGNANATAVVTVDWVIINTGGEISR